MDNLDSQTYEIFEKDPIKYVQYEKVNIIIIRTALLCVYILELALNGCHVL